MLSTAQQPHKRGHRHKRSAAISGDFDAMGMDFFKSPQQTIKSNGNNDIGTTAEPEVQYNSLPKDYSFGAKRSNQPLPPSLVITDENNQSESKPKDLEKLSNTPSPQKKHTRLNSWAHSFIKKDDKHSSTKDYNSSSSTSSSPNDQTIQSNINNNTNTNAYKSSQFTYGPAPSSNSNYYDIPEAIIDLDKAQELIYDPNLSNSIPRKKFLHRRTESAPELEDFLKFKVFSNDQHNNSLSHNNSNDFMINDNNNNNKHSNSKNSAIFEEDEEDEEDEDIISSTSSSNLTNNNNSNNINNGSGSVTLLKNESTNSLNSNPSLNLKLQSPATMNSASNSIFNTPTSIKTQQQQQQQQQPRRGGANAARYQSYYKNSLALSNALKSSESLLQITGGGNQSLNNKSSISSFQTSLYKNQHLSSAASSITSSSALNSPSRFKFESKVYDMPDKEDSKHTYTPSTSISSSTAAPRPQATSTNISSPISTSSITHSELENKTTSPTKPTRQLYIHKKSNSLLSSINLRIRRNSTNSTKSSSNLPSSMKSNTNLHNPSEDDLSNANDEDDEEDIGDKTLTPQFNFGEPGPELDLVTMTPKISKSNRNSQINFDDFKFTPKQQQQPQQRDLMSREQTPQRTPEQKIKDKRTSHKKFFHWLKK